MADGFADSLYKGAQLGLQFVQSEQQEKLVRLREQEQNLRTWAAVGKVADEEDEGMAGLMINSIFNSAGIDPKDPARKQFEGLLSAKNAGGREQVKNFIAGLGPEMKDLPLSAVFKAVRKGDLGALEKIQELSEKGKQRRAFQDVMREGTAGDQTLSQMLGVGQQAAAPAAPIQSGLAETTAPGATQAADPAMPLIGGEGASRVPGGSGTDDLSARYKKLQALELKLGGLGSPEATRAAAQVKNVMEQLVKSAWEPKTINGIMFDVNRLTGERKGHGQVPETYSSRDILGPNGELIGVENRGSRGKREFSARPETFQLVDPADPLAKKNPQGITQISNKGRIAVEGNKGPAEETIPRSDPIYAGQPKETVFKGVRTADGYTNVQKITGSGQTEQDASVKKAGEGGVKTLEESDKELVSQTKFIGMLNSGLNASRAGDAGAYQGLVRTVKSFLQPLGIDIQGLGSAEVANAMYKLGGLGAVSDVSDRPSRLLLETALESGLKENSSPEAKQFLVKVMQARLELSRKVHRARQEWFEENKSLINVKKLPDGSGTRTVQDEIERIVLEHNSSPKVQKLQDELAGIKPSTPAAGKPVPGSSQAAGNWMRFDDEQLDKFAKGSSYKRLPADQQKAVRNELRRRLGKPLEE